MLFGLIDRVSSATTLKDTLDIASQHTRAIAQRVATATLQNGTGFALPAGAGGVAPVNLEQEMTSLADEQLRFETAEKLLEKTYQNIRVSFKST